MIYITHYQDIPKKAKKKINKGDGTLISNIKEKSILFSLHAHSIMKKIFSFFLVHPNDIISIHLVKYGVFMS